VYPKPLVNPAKKGIITRAALITSSKYPKKAFSPHYVYPKPLVNPAKKGIITRAARITSSKYPKKAFSPH